MVPYLAGSVDLRSVDRFQWLYSSIDRGRDFGPRTRRTSASCPLPSRDRSQRYHHSRISPGCSESPLIRIPSKKNTKLEWAINQEDPSQWKWASARMGIGNVIGAIA